MARFRFHVNRNPNLFCHTICLFPESYRSEGSAFNNPKYREKWKHLRTPRLANLFSKLLRVGWGDWDFVGLSLLNGVDASDSLEVRTQKGFARLAKIWSAILEESWKGYSHIWPAVEAQLIQYKSHFEEEWNATGEDVLRVIEQISQADWDPERIDVYLIDCFNGGASYVDTVLLPPVLNLEVEKKLFSHELSEGAFADTGLQRRLESLGVNPKVSHTIVDTTAYYAVKGWLKPESVERLKPNPAYYTSAEAVQSAFEECAVLSKTYLGLDKLLTTVKRKCGSA